MQLVTCKYAYPDFWIDDWIKLLGKAPISSTFDATPVNGRWRSPTATITKCCSHRHMDFKDIFICRATQGENRPRSSMRWTWFYRHSSSNSLSSILTIMLYSLSHSRITSGFSFPSMAYCWTPKFRCVWKNVSSSAIKLNTLVTL